MTYTINMPLPTDTLAQSQPRINTNFTLANTYFGSDHVAFNAGASNGFHQKISFTGNSPATSPIPITQEGITMLSNISGSRFTISYIERNSGATHETIQLTAKTAPLTAATGRSFLPGRTAVWQQSMGMIIQWGTVTAPAGESGVIGFPIAFQAAPYNIQLTPIRSSTSTATPMFISSSHPPTSTDFRIVNTSSNAHDVYWMAIGQEQV